MKKLKFNYITGNRFDGYIVTYFKENGEELNFTIHPYNNYLYYNKNLNFDYPSIPKYNTVFTGPVYFEAAKDESIFDPYSVSYLAKSTFINTRSSLTDLVPCMTNKAFAYPLRYQNFVKTNHYLNNFFTDYADYDVIKQQYNVSNYNKSGSVELKHERRISIVEEQYVKESFSMGISKSVDEIEAQTGKNYYDIVNSSLSGCVGAKYIVSTTEEALNHTTKLSLSLNGADTSEYYPERQNFIPSGLIFENSTYSENEYAPVIQNDEKITDTYKPNYFDFDPLNELNPDIGGGFEIFTPSGYIVEAQKSEELPDYVLFRNEMFVLADYANFEIFMFMLPVYNEANMDDYYLQNIKVFDGTHLPPLSAGLLSQDLRRARLRKDIEAQKWILEFSTSTTTENSQIGHFEAPLSSDLFADIFDADYNLLEDKLFKMYYVDPDGNINDENPLIIYRFMYYAYKVGPSIPELFGDKRFDTNVLSKTELGTYLKPNVKIYEDNYQQNTYLACDIASYSILI